MINFMTSWKLYQENTCMVNRKLIYDWDQPNSGINNFICAHKILNNLLIVRILQLWRMSQPLLTAIYNNGGCAVHTVVEISMGYVTNVTFNV